MQYDVHVNLQIRLRVGRVVANNRHMALDIASRTLGADLVVQSGCQRFAEGLPHGHGLRLLGLTIDCEKVADAPAANGDPTETQPSAATRVQQPDTTTPDDSHAQRSLLAALRTVSDQLRPKGLGTVATTPIHGFAYVLAHAGVGAPILWYCPVASSGEIDGEDLLPCNTLADVQEFGLDVESMSAITEALEAWARAPAFVTLSLRARSAIAVQMAAVAWYYANGCPKDGHDGYYGRHSQAEHYAAEWYHQAADEVRQRLRARHSSDAATTPIGAYAFVLSTVPAGAAELFFGHSQGRGDLEAGSIQPLSSRQDALDLCIGAVHLREAAAAVEAWLEEPSFQTLSAHAMTDLTKELKLIANCQ